MSLIDTPQRIRVLVIDDDDLDRERVTRMLKRADSDTQIIEAESAGEAINLCTVGSIFDCIVLDYRLGDVTGVDLLPGLKEAAGKYCPIIMITGLGDEHVAVDAIRNGAFDYLIKSELDTEKLLTAIYNGLRHERLQQEIAEAEAKLRHLSLYDALTGLPNRNMFFDHVENLFFAGNRYPGNARFTVFMMDLNLFKEVNDRLGHEAGDQVLEEVARRLQTLARASDVYARIGGDEFVCTLLGVDSMEAAARVAEKICTSIRQPMVVAGEVVSIDISIGIAFYPQDGSNRRELFAHADEAMYMAKRGSKGYTFFQQIRDPASNQPSSILLGNRLAEAIEHNELYLCYQPKISLYDGSIVGTESLIRWTNQEGHTIAPIDFMPVAERASIIYPLTYMIFEMAMNQATKWWCAGLAIPVSVNLSARMLDDDEFIDKLEYKMAQRQLPHEALIIELTETALISNPNQAIAVLDAFRNRGFAISIDDFGAGYTSLGYLRHFDVHEIKIDQSFISNLQPAGRDASIVRSIATLGEGFGMHVTAEGIESEELWPILGQLGCDYGQGYSIARPMLPHDFQTWVDTWNTIRLQRFPGTVNT